MILTNRRFEREAPVREAKSIYIFCEGLKREYQYFEYFKEMDSRINVEIYKLDSHEDNSPLGLLAIAKKSIILNVSNPKPKYTFQKNDEVWIVLDTDKDKDESRGTQIETIKKNITEFDNWNLAESNPCFEVWLFYHLDKLKPDFEGNEYCAKWKEYVNESIKGGFDSRKHPIYIQAALKNSEANFEFDKTRPNIGSTEVFKLSKSILPLVKSKLQRVINEL